MELGIRLSFVKTSEFQGDLNLPNLHPPGTPLGKTESLCVAFPFNELL
jgi:hypothetical protein